MRSFITNLFLIFSALSISAQELVIVEEATDTIAVKEYTPEELAEIRAKHMEELLPNTRALVFIDSLIVNKDDFLPRLRMSAEAGRFTHPETIIPHERIEAETGHTAFVNALDNTAIFSIADTLGILHLNTAYRNGEKWSDPQPINELHNFTYQDYPFLCTDGATLYFAADGVESIGGLDLFVTRYNEETRQYVRPQNLGFPYNSPANDYLLAIDEELGVGVLVSDRQQPDDKVCIYWFIAEEQRNIYDYDPEDEEAEAIVRELAAIARIADTQDGQQEQLEAIRKRWDEALFAESKIIEQRYTFVIDNSTIYHSLSDFKNEEARSFAEQWLAAHAELIDLEARQQKLRNDYAATHDVAIAPTLLQLETQLPQKRKEVHKLEKQYRAAEK